MGLWGLKVLKSKGYEKMVFMKIFKMKGKKSETFEFFGCPKSGLEWGKTKFCSFYPKGHPK